MTGYIKDIKEKKDEDLLVLPTDAALFEDPSFKVSWSFISWLLQFNAKILTYQSNKILMKYSGICREIC